MISDRAIRDPNWQAQVHQTWLMPIPCESYAGDWVHPTFPSGAHNSFVALQIPLKLTLASNDVTVHRVPEPLYVSPLPCERP